ncbi:Ger(x)C family spore germination protein [Virgibacillus sp. LDC-1]|uniref:Ger(x)C family spore germination protein n=1 Tax=Virgibacillus sp. LDC-1 TaxID=3039856 RepID=UPI0024DE0057|nr:Ger(x)C family spore germination protein [Virgibacillus sp. LDC-1]
MRIIQWIKLLIVACVFFLLAGCWDEKEIGEVDYATVMGIDYKDDQYKLYVQLLDFANVAKQEGVKQTQPAPIYIGKSSGSTLNEAINQLVETSQQVLNWGHVGAVVYSEAALKNGLEKIEQSMRRSGEFRNSAWMYGTKEPIEELLSIPGFFNTPPLYTILYKPKDFYKEYSYIKPNRMYNFVSIYKDPGGTSLLPSLSIDRDDWTEAVVQNETKKTLKINGVFPIEYDGKYTDWLDKDEIPGLKWVGADIQKSPLKLEKDGKKIGSVEVERPKSKIKQIRGGTAPIFEIEIKAEGSVEDLITSLSEREIVKQAKEEIEKEIRKTYETAVEKQVDIYNFKNELFRNGMSPRKLKDVHLTKESLGKVKVYFTLESMGIYE